MQRIYPCSLSPEEYLERGAYRKVIPERACPRCGSEGRLHHHGSYERRTTANSGLVIRIMVARFLCIECGGTVSYLPEFALSYRLVQTSTFEAFLDSKLDRRDVQRWFDLLRQYSRKMLDNGIELLRFLGDKYGRGPPGPKTLWLLLKREFGSLAAATSRLVIQFRITVFGRYQCHQPAPLD
jgi:transposase-like protein